MLAEELKESYYQLIGHKPKFNKQRLQQRTGRLLGQNHIFGDVFPFTEISISHGSGPPAKLAALVKGLDHQRVRVAILSEALAMSIPGQIVRKRETMVNGSRTLSLGIQFDEVFPRVRGAFLAFAEGTGNFDKARNETGQG